MTDKPEILALQQSYAVCRDFTREYPETIKQRLASIQLAIQSARRISDLLDEIGKKITQRFLEMKSEI